MRVVRAPLRRRRGRRPACWPVSNASCRAPRRYDARRSTRERRIAKTGWSARSAASVLFGPEPLDAGLGTGRSRGRARRPRSLNAVDSEEGRGRSNSPRGFGPGSVVVIECELALLAEHRQGPVWLGLAAGSLEGAIGEFMGRFFQIRIRGRLACSSNQPERNKACGLHSLAGIGACAGREILKRGFLDELAQLRERDSMRWVSSAANA